MRRVSRSACAMPCSNERTALRRSKRPERLLDEGAEGIGLAFNAGFDLADALNAPFAGGLDADRGLVEAMLPQRCGARRAGVLRQ